MAYLSPRSNFDFEHARRATLRAISAFAVVSAIPRRLFEDIAPTRSAGNSDAAGPVSSREQVQLVLGRHVAEYYRVPEPLARQIIRSVWQHANCPQIEPLLVLALIGVESSHNPRAVSIEGAQGLMQIIPRFHTARLNVLRPGATLFDPDANIELGVVLLRELLHRSRGDIQTALQRYNGSLRDRTTRYSTKVFAETERLRQVATSIA